MTLATTESKPDWYERLLLDLKKMELTGIVITKWNQGKRILQDELKFDRAEYGSKTITNLAKDLGASPRDVYRCIQFAKKYELCHVRTQFEDVSWYRIVNEFLPEHREAAEPPPFPAGSFDIMYADPPWQYEFSETNSRSIEAHYETMPAKEIIELKDRPNFPKPENGVLFLWATAPKLIEAFQVMKAWNFEYRTNAVWDKEKIGMGYWFRGQHELLLVGTRGNVSAPAVETRFSSVIRSPREEHSRKPALVYEMIETMFPEQNRIELFLRGPARTGWVGWGRDAS